MYEKKRLAATHMMTYIRDVRWWRNKDVNRDLAFTL